MKRFVWCLAGVVLVAGPAAADFQPGRLFVTPQAGTVLPRQELLRNTANYRTFRITDPENPVVTDISLGPAMLLGARVAYSLSRTILVEAELDWTLTVHTIRQLEIKDDADPEDLPQYETTSTDARIWTYGVSLTWAPRSWGNIQPFGTFGVAEHVMDLVQKGSVDPDPVRDRSIVVGLGSLFQANDRLGIRVEVRDFMYNFRYDNQFVDPARADEIVDPLGRPDFYRTTSISGTKFQHDFALTVGFQVRIR